jgi:hypothetical protein
MLAGQNQAFSSGLNHLMDKAGAKITSAIQKASSKTGVDFAYLLQQAKVESGFRSDVKASTSSATGLYQFIDKTWLSMVDKYGSKYGLGEYSEKISEHGKISCSQTKQEILELRKNPELASLMAAELAADNKSYLERCTQLKIGATELYLAHFMGPNGAGKFLNTLENNPSANASALFPAAAKANKNIFFDKSGNPRTVQEIYSHFDKKFSINDTTQAPSKSADTHLPVKQDNKNSLPPSLVDTNYDILLPLITTYNVHKSMVDLSTPLSHTLFKDTEYVTGNMPKPLFHTLISPIDVLELIKNQESKDNSSA